MAEIGLNPCFNGRYSLRANYLLQDKVNDSLNPCFNGRYSLRTTKMRYMLLSGVLILVLMEDTH